MMRRVIAGIFLVGSIEQAVCQAPTPPVKSGISDKVRIDSLQTRKRDDDNGIASFAIANETEKQINSLELTCWDRKQPRARNEGNGMAKSTNPASRHATIF